MRDDMIDRLVMEMKDAEIVVIKACDGIEKVIKCDTSTYPTERVTSKEEAQEVCIDK